MALQLVNPPTIEPVTVEECRDHSRIPNTLEDTYIAGLIETARRQVESFTLRALLFQDWDLWFDWVPTATNVSIPRPPLSSVATVLSWDTDNSSTVFDPSNYVVDTSTTFRGRVFLNSGSSWPSNVRTYKAISISFKAGYGATRDTVPPDLRHAIKLMVADWFEGREPVERMGQSVLSMLSPYRVLSL